MSELKKGQVYKTKDGKIVVLVKVTVYFVHYKVLNEKTLELSGEVYTDKHNFNSSYTRMV